MKDRWGWAFVAWILLVGGLELFFRFATVGLLKVAAVGLVASGIVVLGWSGLGRDQLLPKLAVALVFVAYLVHSTSRFPGLVKDATPGASSEISILALKALLTLCVLTALVAAAAHGVRAVARRLRSGGEGTTPPRGSRPAPGLRAGP